LLNNLDNGVWNLTSANENTIKQKIDEKGIPLKNWDIKMNFGIKTGFNEAYIIDNQTKEKLISLDSKNIEIIKPLLRGRDIRKYHINYANLWLINTHNGFIEKIKDANIKKMPIICMFIRMITERKK